MSDSSSLVFSFEGGPGETLVGECAERMYTLHPKKKNLVLVPVALLSAVNGTGDVQKFLIEVETCHASWCKSEDWTKSGGRYAPPLDMWISDRGYTKYPTPDAPRKSDFAANVERVLAKNIKETGKPW